MITSPDQNPILIRWIFTGMQSASRGYSTGLLVMIIIGLVAGIVIVLSTNNTFAATILGLCMLPVLAAFYSCSSKKFEWAAVFWQSF